MACLLLSRKFYRLTEKRPLKKDSGKQPRIMLTMAQGLTLGF